MADIRFESALDACLRAIRNGATVQECLERYPAYAKELKPLLAAARRLLRDAAAPMPATYRARSRARLLAQVRRPTAKPAGGFSWGRLVALPIAAAVAGIALFLGMGGLQAPNTSEASTVLTVLAGEVRIEGPDGSRPAENGMTIGEGESVVTGAGARAVLTFFDGSTVTIEGDSNVAIESVAAVQGELRVLLNQRQGRTWTHIPSSLAPAQIEIDTPSGRLHSRDAQFVTRVENDGRTWVGATSGAVEVSSGDERAAVSSGYQVTLEAPGVVGEPVASDQSASELALLVSGHVYAVLTTPDETSIGTLPSGVPVNQIAGATAEEPAESAVFHLPEPVDGAYQLIIRSLRDGPVTVAASLAKNPAVELETVDLEEDGFWLLRFAIDEGELRVVDSAPIDSPADLLNIMVPQLAEDRAIALLTATSQPPASATPQATSTPTRTPTRTPTSTPTPSATPSITLTPSATPTIAASATP
jgi:hypothetical protein